MDAKLKINGKTEITIGEGVFSIGRTSDNFLPLNDANTSRYHAEIESKDGGYTLIELGSSNGTTVNGTPLTSQVGLCNGDVILFGGTSEVIFNPKEETPEETPKTDETPQDIVKEKVAPTEEIPPASSKMPLMIGIAAVTVGLAIVAVVAVGLIYFTETKCEATARIISPENGETISKALEIEVDAKNTECVGRARFELNGEEIATANQTPYTTTLDPSQFPELADGGTYDLQVILEDKGGKTIQTGIVSVAFETIEEKPKSTPTPEIIDVKPTQQTPKISQSRQISLADTQAMYQGILNQFKSGSFRYKPDNQFLQQVQARTNEYRVEGYYANAQKYKDQINLAFFRDNGLDPALGYLLAMSRSKFNPAKDKNDEGLWRMTNDFANVNAFNGTCGNETLSEATQDCAAKTAAVYLKALLLNVFEGDVIYAVSCFGMSPNEASLWKSTLPADRANFWQTIKNPKQKEEVVKFFAAAIVAENPQKFGMKRDRPISEIYKVLMNQP
jgi:pSer/pThr/pTyr-binding forkhead associated (FHA) protein